MAKKTNKSAMYTTEIVNQIEVVKVGLFIKDLERFDNHIKKMKGLSVMDKFWIAPDGKNDNQMTHVHISGPLGKTLKHIETFK